jgi:uncharacterized protein
MVQDLDKQFVEYVVKSIVEFPEKVKVDRKVDEMGVLLELTVEASDMGKIIGKDGRTAKAVRTLLRVIGAQNHSRVNLKIIEPEGGTGGKADMTHANESAGAEVDMPEMTTKDDLKDIAE